ncbi:unnamed protein product [Didymodactylos carnosus]|uniref:DDE-1 domain-containing protein n=1 Tax=Didymodactylos carnosus TaxID=1234261 RepID=A0A815XER1_9BILA|nr:unnamed protein product [Didymodactylos carnosus]CAF4417769.1 unnamed protein product [Didymodactylos carnosus]
MDKPSQIFNCDESGFADKTDTSKVIVASPTKFPYKKQGGSGGRSYNSVLFCVSASGVILPPYIIYKAIKLYSNWCTKGPDGTGYNTSKNGWMEENIFFQWFKNMFIPLTATTPKPILLLLDGHTSHQSVRTVELAVEHNIILLLLPPHSTTILQPLDVTFFKPIKQKYREILNEYYSTSGYKNVSKPIFPSLTAKLFKSSAVRKVNVIKGFMNTGIYPLDRTLINEKKILKCNEKIEGSINANITSIHHGNSRTTREIFSASVNTGERDEENKPGDLIPINLSTWDHDSDTNAPLDLSHPIRSTIEISQSSTPFSPTKAICNALRHFRPPPTEEPPIKKIVLDREAGQLLTAEQVLKQLREKEQLKASIQSRKAKRTPATSTPKRKVTRINKKVAFKDDLLVDTHNSLATTGSSNTLPLSVFVSSISSSTAVHSTLTTDPVFSTSTSLLNMHQPSLVASQPSQISNDLWNNTGLYFAGIKRTMY